MSAPRRTCSPTEPAAPSLSETEDASIQPGHAERDQEIRARSAGAPSENPERAAEYAARGPNMRG